jgi:hypothetical protein
MPAYTDTQVTNQNIADLYAYFSSLPRVAQIGPWRWQHPPAGAPLGQQLQSAVGCGQCHEPEMGIPRRWLGGAGADYEYFTKQVYDHTEQFPKGQMGNYSRMVLPDMVLREIWKFIVDAGLRAFVTAGLTVGPREGDNSTYTLTVTNGGAANKGLAAEAITIFVRIPPGTQVVSATGTGYKGTRPLAQIGLLPAVAATPGRFDPSKLPERPKPDLTGDVALWQVPRLGAAEKQIYTLTLSGPGPTAEVLRGFIGSTVYWETPGVRMPTLAYRDFRMPDKGDHVAIGVPSPKPAQ